MTTTPPVSVTVLAPRVFSQQAHRRLIGWLGFVLPALLFLVAGLRHTDGLVPWQLLPSMSAYYYTGAVGIFVGVLFALSLFLFTYPGYEGALADRVLGSLAGAAALGVALFPTTAPDAALSLTWWAPWVRTIHYASAVSLFVSFILFSIWLFRKSSVPERRNRPREKRNRDGICLACGVVMIVCVLWAGSSLVTHSEIFVPEGIAVMAFAVSWLVKGEAYQPVIRTFRRYWPVRAA